MEIKIDTQAEIDRANSTAIKAIMKKIKSWEIPEMDESYYDNWEFTLAQMAKLHTKSSAILHLEYFTREGGNEDIAYWQGYKRAMEDLHFRHTKKSFNVNY